MPKHNGPNDSAFPSYGEINGREVVGSEGLTTREYFAAKALSLLAAYPAFRVGQCPSADDIADWAFEIADAMLARTKQ
jgi:hypothetical protein